MGALKEQLGKHVARPEQRIFDEKGEPQKVSEPTPLELADTHVAPGEKAHLPLGIEYHGPWKFAADGLGSHCREQVKALASTGLPLRLVSLGSSRLLNEELHEDVRDVEYLSRVTFSQTAVAIKQFIFSSLDLVQELICPAKMRTEANEKLLGQYTILCTSWERDRVYPELVTELNKVAQVWVPCERNRQAFASSGVKNVRVVPYPYDPRRAKIAFPRGSDAVPDGKRFYHIGKWEPRKNQHQLLGAFLQAFKPKEKASLLIKTSGFGGQWSNYPDPEESVQFWLEHPAVVSNGWTAEALDRRVRIISERITEADIEALHQRNNIYVSSGLGEAWDIPSFDAKLAGNRMVYVGFGGPEDFASEGDVRVPFDMGPVHPGYDWEPDAQWAKVRTEDMAAALRTAEPQRRMTPPEYCRQFSYQATGQRMVKHLSDVVPVQDLFQAGGFG